MTVGNEFGYKIQGLRKALEDERDRTPPIPPYLCTF
jgi:hypothetical protein